MLGSPGPAAPCRRRARLDGRDVPLPDVVAVLRLRAPARRRPRAAGGARGRATGSSSGSRRPASVAELVLGVERGELNRPAVARRVDGVVDGVDEVEVVLEGAGVADGDRDRGVLRRRDRVELAARTARASAVVDSTMRRSPCWSGAPAHGHRFRPTTTSRIHFCVDFTGHAASLWLHTRDATRRELR